MSAISPKNFSKQTLELRINETFREPTFSSFIFALFCSISASLVSSVFSGRTLNNGIVFYTFTCKRKLADYRGNK